MDSEAEGSPSSPASPEDIDGGNGNHPWTDGRSCQARSRAPERCGTRTDFYYVVGPPPPRQGNLRVDRGESGANSDTLSGSPLALSGVRTPYNPRFSTLTWPLGVS